LAFAAAIGVTTLTAGGIGAADDKPVDLKVGDKAPVFQATDDTGRLWKSSEHVGKKLVVVYFFPAAFTGG
jgi:peroxiredoxin Q/BCP